MGHSVQPGQRKLFSGEPSCLETSWTSQPVCLLQPVLILNFFENFRQAGLVMMIRPYRQPRKAVPKRPPTKRVSFLLDWGLWVCYRVSNFDSLPNLTPNPIITSSTRASRGRKAPNTPRNIGLSSHMSTL